MTNDRYMDTAVTAFRNGKIIGECGFAAADVLDYRACYIAIYDFGQYVGDFDNMDEDDVRIMACEDAVFDRADADVKANAEAVAQAARDA